MEQYDHRVDAYIAKAPEFAQPILMHLRELIHATSPLITETIKWGFPFFEYNGTLANMAAFKEHCSFGFWNSSSIVDLYGVIHRGGEKESAGNFGRLTKLSDLPFDDILKDFILQAIALNEKSGKKAVVKKTASAPKAPIETPDYFIGALEKKPKAKAVFEAFSPSHKREYLEWIIDAKTEPTRQKRIEQALEWMSEGKSRNWKYK
ncbi:MAG TPA: YdeI/OmpD-associated family protein [Mucilaginibacter sp.]